MMSLQRELLNLKGSWSWLRFQHCHESNPEDLESTVVLMDFNLEFFILCNLKATPNSVDVGDKGMQKGGEMLSPCIERSNVWELKRVWKEKGSKKGGCQNENISKTKWKWTYMRWILGDLVKPSLIMKNSHLWGEVMRLTELAYWGIWCGPKCLIVVGTYELDIWYMQLSSGQWAIYMWGELLRGSHPVGMNPMKWAAWMRWTMRLTLVGSGHLFTYEVDSRVGPISEHLYLRWTIWGWL